MTLATIRATIVAWLKLVRPTDTVVFTKQNGPEIKVPECVYVDITRIIVKGNPSYGSRVEDVSGKEVVTDEIKVYTTLIFRGEDPMQKAMDVQKSLLKHEINELFLAQDIAPEITETEIVDTSEVDTNKWFKEAQMPIAFSASIDTDSDTGYYDSIYVTVTVKDQLQNVKYEETFTLPEA